LPLTCPSLSQGQSRLIIIACQVLWKFNQLSGLGHHQVIAQVMHPVSAVASSSAILTVSYLALLICSAVAGVNADSTIDATRRSWDDGPACRFGRRTSI
ncbi:hypothetical protein BOX15_Mlig032804g4, partial [Macrostomum lignano]